MSGLYFNEESDYSEQNTCDNKVFRSTPFFNHFSLSDPEQKRKKLNIFTLQLPIYYQEISIGANADITETKQEKQIVFVVERWMQRFLFPLKSRIAREPSCHPAFKGNCPTISHTCQPHLPCRLVFPFVPGVAEQNEEAG